AQADGASRLVLRTELKGAETNSFTNLHFVIAGTNSANNGWLSAIGSTNQSVDVPAAIASAGGTNKAACIYESPVDFPSASQAVVVQLRNGNRVIATNTVALRRPPAVLVHGQWSEPKVWGLLFDRLI